MSDENPHGSGTGGSEREPADGERPRGIPPLRRGTMPLPGVAAISLYMLLLSGINVLGVAGGHEPRFYLIFSAVFIAASLGLLLMLRWAWALTLAAVMLLAAMFLWKFAGHYGLPFLVQGLLNLVFFLYLIRTEVREKLR